MKRILAVDLGTKTGWALHGEYSLKGDPVIQSGSVNLQEKSKDYPGLKFFRFRKFLDDLATSHLRIDAVYYEHVPRHNGVAAAHFYGALWGVLSIWCHEKSIPCRGLNVSLVKSHATGKGNSNKEVMMAAARAKGWAFADDNEADALWILDLAICKLKEEEKRDSETDNPERPAAPIRRPKGRGRVADRNRKAS